MGRDVLKRGAESVPYIPEAFGIRASWLAGEEPTPVTVWVRPATAASMSRTSVRGLDAKQRKALAMGDDEALHDARRRAFAEMIERVENYSAGGVPIVTGEELFDRGEVQIVNEVDTAASNFAQLDAGDRERFGS